MVKSTPASSFIMIQPQIVFAPLKILFDGPSSPAQTQAPAFGGRLFEPGDVNMVRIRLSFGPVDDQPAWWPLSGLFVQVAVQINLFPSQSGRPFFATCRFPKGCVPLRGFEVFSPLPQRSGFGSALGDTPQFSAGR